MRIFEVGKTSLKKYFRKTVEKEEYMEAFLEKHIEVLDPSIFVIGRQVRAGDKNLVDLMGMDRDGNAVIIELKRGMSPREAISQTLDYAAWAKNAGYNELNGIAKKHLGKYSNLHELFQSKFNFIPDTWNGNQKIYIVAECIDEKIIKQAKLIKPRIDIKCVEFNFYEGTGKEIVCVNFVVGDPSDEMDTIDTIDDKTAEKWEAALDRADENNRSAVSDLIIAAEKRLNPLAAPQNKYYYMRVKGKTKKNLFGVIQCQKKLAYVLFRVDPDTFPHDDSPEVRSVGRWFFDKHTERKIRLTRPNFDLILRCLEHAHEATSKL